MRAARVPAGIIGAALADLALPVDGGLPAGLGDLADRGLLPRAELPADGPGDLVAVPGGEPVQLLDQGVAGAGPVAGDHQLPAQRRRQRGDRLVQEAQVIGGGVAARRAGAQHPGQRLRRVIAGGDDRVMTEPFEVRLCQFLARRALPVRASICIQASSSQASATISHQTWFCA